MAATCQKWKMPISCSFLAMVGPTPPISSRSSASPMALSSFWNFEVSMPAALAAATPTT